MRLKDLHNTLKNYNLPVKINIDTDNGIISKYFKCWNKTDTKKYDNLLVITKYLSHTQTYIIIDLLGD